MGTHLRVVSEGYISNEDQHDEFRCIRFSKNLCVLVLWTKVASALERLMG